MRSNVCRVRLSGWLIASLSGCAPDIIAQGYYGAPDDAGAEVPPSSPVEPHGMPPSADEGDAQAGVESDAAPSDAQAPVGTGPATTTGCDLTGRWLATDHQVSSGL